MKSAPFRLPVPNPPDGDIELHVSRWEPDGSAPKAVVQIVHGMAEYGSRYARLAEALTSAGYAVYADDHRGHGQSAGAGVLGHFADEDGWSRIVADVHALRERIRADHPGLPHFLLGHSMGSFMVQDYLFTHGDAVDAVVLSGSTLAQPAVARAGRGVAKVERLRVGRRKSSSVVEALAMGQNNKRVADRRTDSDWLSRDPAEVDAYVADPLLGFELTVQGWIDVFTGLMRIGSTANIARVRKDLPLYIFSGSEDPVGGYGKGVHALTEAYRKAGVRDVTERIYEGGRHEMLNEVNREEVQADLVAWLDRTLDRLARSAA